MIEDELGILDLQISRDSGFGVGFGGGGLHGNEKGLSTAESACQTQPDLKPGSESLPMNDFRRPRS
jgi:hypothetical protein